MAIQTYLFFDGRCEEAIEFYKATLNAEVLALMRFSDAPPQEAGGGEGCGGAMPAGDKVMHAHLRIADTELLASDGNATGAPKFEGFGLALTAPTVPEAERLFSALGDGGEVQMPLTQTFFSPAFGMVADRFGVTWMILAAK
jgi:PhnB protein